MSEKKDNDNELPHKKRVSILEPSHEEKPSSAGSADAKLVNNAEDLSEEDKVLKEGLELAVQRLQESDVSLHKQALDHLINEIRSATASMTAVPKPLKFLRLHYGTLKNVYTDWSFIHELKQDMADVLSVLAMTMAPKGSRESLKFKLEGTQSNISSWGHEYVRSLAGEISEEYHQRKFDAPAGEDADVDDLMALVDDIVPFQMSHNAEADAVDLLMEVQKLDKLLVREPAPVVDERNYERVCLYLLRSADFTSDPEDLDSLFVTAFTLYKAQHKHTDALRVALRMDDRARIDELFNDMEVTSLAKKQMAFILARQRSYYVVEDDDVLNDIIGSVNLSDRFKATARNMDVLDPKHPDDIYKTNSLTGPARRRNGLPNASNTDSARENLASSFVNAFVNAGFNTDKLMTVFDSNWIHKQKDHGKISATASLGMILLWNIDEGLNQIDKYLNNSEDYIKAGACLGIGILSSGVRNESDAALAILTDYVSSKSSNVRLTSICGLGIAYAGSRKEEISELLLPVFTDPNAKIDEVSLAALSLGLVWVGSCNHEIAEAILLRLHDPIEDDLSNSIARFLCLGLGLLFLGKGEESDIFMETVKAVEHKICKYAEITLEACAYAGTGNVLKVQQMLRHCAEHLTENAEHQAAAVLGIALLSIGEDISIEMTLRTFDHLLHYCELPVKRVVPLALALLYISHPDYSVIDQLSRLSHDQDAELSQSAIIGLGLVSAGTNNSRVAGLLRQLSEYYVKEANHLYIVRLAQGLNAMGKGLIGISPFHSDRLLLIGPALGGILAVLHAVLDLKTTLLDKYHYLLYFLTTAMNPRFLSTVDADLNPVSINVRVGQAVETVGQAGRPKTISGFQTHTTPVLLGYRDRAELANKDYTAVSSVMEYVVIVEKAPEETNA